MRACVGGTFAGPAEKLLEGNGGKVFEASGGENSDDGEDERIIEGGGEDFQGDKQ